MQVELKAAFGGLTWLPWWISISQSNLSPLLDLQDDRIVYKIIGRGEARYEDVVAVDFRRTIGTRNVQLAFKGSCRTFTGNVADDGQARAALAMLRDKGCPLSDRASAYLGEGPS